MPTFDTPTPIDVSFALQSARLEIVATERTDTVVTLAPRDPKRAGDVAHMEQTTVTLTDGRLSIVAPKRWVILGAGNDSIVVTIELPTGSRVSGEIAFGNVRGTGRLAHARVKSSYGDVQFDEVGTADLRTSSGNISIATAHGDVELTTSNGGIRADLIEGNATAKTSNGEIAIGEITGALTASGSGAIRVDHAGNETFAKISYGNIRIGEASHGSVRLEGAYGHLEVGIPEGTAAWLDLHSGHGFVRNELATDTAPRQGDRTVEVRARTNWGDIVINRPTPTTKGSKK